MKLNKTEDVLRNNVDEVTAPLTDLVDSIEALEQETESDEAESYREEIAQQAREVLLAWDTVGPLLARLAKA